MFLRKRTLFFSLVLISSFILAIVAAIDSSIIQSYSKIYSTEKIPWLFSFSSFFIGLIITFFLFVFFSLSIRGKSIGSYLLDPSFRRLRLMHKSEVKYQILAGFGNASTTLGYFVVLSMLVDPSIILPFKQVVILYLLIAETISEKNAPTLVEIQSSIIVTFGAILSSISMTGDFNFESLLIMFLVVNPGLVFLFISQRKLMLMKFNNMPNDSINIRFWNLVFSFIFITLFLVIYDFFTGTNYLGEGFESSLLFFWPVALSMTVGLFSILAYIRSLKIGKTSVAQAIRASTILFSIPISFVLSQYVEISFPDSPVIWLIRFMGYILVIIGIITFALSEIKAFVFIKVEPKVKKHAILELVSQVKGVESACVVFAANHDIIAYVRTRTLLRGYTQIVQKLEKTPGIQKVKFISIIKEWENL
ncbi:MAG: hypothetical protein QXX20_01730 [Candidatus Thermoplasmatota archaeon]